MVGFFARLISKLALQFSSRPPPPPPLPRRLRRSSPGVAFHPGSVFGSPGARKTAPSGPRPRQNRRSPTTDGRRARIHERSEGRRRIDERPRRKPRASEDRRSTRDRTSAGKNISIEKPSRASDLHPMLLCSAISAEEPLEGESYLCWHTKHISIRVGLIVLSIGGGV